MLNNNTHSLKGEQAGTAGVPRVQQQGPVYTETAAQKDINYLNIMFLQH